MGFEPTDPRGSPVFKTGALGHYATSPRREIDNLQKASVLEARPLTGRQNTYFSLLAEEERFELSLEIAPH